jgi:glucose/arabinose dehydrogenase
MLTCLVTGALLLLSLAGAGDAQGGLRTAIHATGLSFPLSIVQDPSDPTVQFVLEQGGRVRTVRSGSVLPTDFLDLRTAISSGGERGLLGLAFSPDSIASGRFFVNFTNPAGDTIVARFRRSADPLLADAASRFDLRWGGAGGPAFIAQPFANHNGGHLAFGPDGFLFIGLGDGGSANDPNHRAQAPSELLGKMLRIDVDVPDTNPVGYRVPPDNPFVSSGPAGTRPEIWSFGLRNPWRYTFDDVSRGGSGALVIADVGQNEWEEVNYEPRGQGGRNYGWRNREGAHDHITSRPPAFGPLSEPVLEYNHSQGQSITGGYIYRGRALGPAFQGRYFFADYAQGRVWSTALTLDANGEARASGLVEHTAELGGAGVLGTVSSFGVDSEGELFIVSHSRGTILRILGTQMAPPAMAPPAPSGLRIVP